MWLWVGLAVAAIVLLVLVVVVVTSSSGDQSTATAQPTVGPSDVTDDSPIPTTGTTIARAHSQVIVQALNGSGIQGAATAHSTELKEQGYQVLPAGNAPAIRTGSAVQCRVATDATELIAVLRALGVSAVAEPFPSPIPAGFDTAATCYLLLGR